MRACRPPLARILFPFPKTLGLELMWTIVLLHLPSVYPRELVSDNAYVLSNGNINWGQVRSAQLRTEPENRVCSARPKVRRPYYLNETLLPQRDRGEINTGVEYYNHATEPRQSWRYDPGTPSVSVSRPNTGMTCSSRAVAVRSTVDEVRIFNGSGQRYNWKIVGKQEMYVPANAYRIHSNDVT